MDDVLIDLGVVNRSGLAEVFEINTSTRRADIYGAIGLLLVHGVDQACRRFTALTFEKSITRDLNAGVQPLRIQVLEVALDEAKATILPMRLSVVA
ncbi:MAG: hypothetical protein ABIO17_01160 [Pseudoxanthomonas sp.]